MYTGYRHALELRRMSLGARYSQCQGLKPYYINARGVTVALRVPVDMSVNVCRLLSFS